MTTEAVLIKAEDENCLAEVLDRAAAQLDLEAGEMVLDLTSLSRIDSGGLRALESLIAAAEEKSAKLSLRGANVTVYKVLKLMKLAPRLSFVD